MATLCGIASGSGSRQLRDAGKQETDKSHGNGGAKQRTREKSMSEEKRFPETLPMWGEKKNSVQDVRRFLDALGAPDRDLNIIHVAGTNGKGSVCAYLTQALMDAGKKTGTFLSPHLVSIRERIRINNVPVDEALFSETAERVKEQGERWTREGGAFPAYFEYLYYMAMLIFKETAVDYVLLETGLGGRLDATNSCRPILTVITSISMDHMQYLGNTVEKIAAEKAGIIKDKVPVVYDNNDSRAEAVILKAAEARGAKAIRGTELSKIPEQYGFLPAPYMRRNAQLAERAFQILLERGDFSAGTPFAESVRRTHWEGRMQEILPDVFLDGGHNEDGVRAMTEAAEILCRDRKKQALLLTSAVNDKDLKQVIRHFSVGLAPKKVFLAKLNSGRAADTAQMEALYRSQGIENLERFETVDLALKEALREKQENEILFVAGSLYLVGEVLAAQRENREGQDD